MDHLTALRHTLHASTYDFPDELTPIVLRSLATLIREL